MPFITLCCTIISLIGATGYIVLLECVRRKKVSERSFRYDKLIEEELDLLGSTGVIDLIDASHRQRLLTLMKKRWGSLRYGGRFLNPFKEWREQGAWEYLVWQIYTLPSSIWNYKSIIDSRNRIFQDAQSLDGLLLNLSSTVTDENTSPSSDTPESLKPLESTDTSPSLHKQGSQKDILKFTWIGHSTGLITHRPENSKKTLIVLTDPCFDNSLGFGPVQFKRLRKPALLLDDIINDRQIDIVLVSHNHYDHLSSSDLRKLAMQDPQPLIMVPRGLKSFVRSFKHRRVIELDWFESYDLAKMDASFEDYKVHCIPCMHWSSRHPLNTNRTLWCSWILSYKERNVLLHIGDTGRVSPLFYRAIKATYGEPELGMVPIGAYAPRWHLRPVHIDPDEAWSIATSLGIKHAFGVHYGTFHLADEPVAEPALRLLKLGNSNDLDEDEDEIKELTAPDHFLPATLGRTFEYCPSV